jgi:hypothetical protein
VRHILKLFFQFLIGGLPGTSPHLQGDQCARQLLRCHPQRAHGPRGQAAGQRAGANPIKTFFFVADTKTNKLDRFAL